VAEALNGRDGAAERPGEPRPTIEPPPSPEAPGTPAIAADAVDLKAIRSAVVDAAGVSAGLWLSYLFVLFYLLIAAGAVTHRDLFLENPIKLPFHGVELPLKGFFWLGPALFLVVHAYVPQHFVLLASKAGIFDAQLRAQIAGVGVRTHAAASAVADRQLRPVPRRTARGRSSGGVGKTRSLSRLSMIDALLDGIFPTDQCPPR
jgi:hypothetical protein